MRIIAGIYGGHTIQAPKTRDVRPTTDRVKGSIFNILANRFPFTGASVLDLFAGSGSLGFEALSRGADHVDFLDPSPVSVRTLRGNIAKLRCGESCSIIAQTAESFLRSCNRAYDLIFTDPPYAYTAAQYETLAGMIASSGAIRSGGILLMKYTTRRSFTIDPIWVELTTRTFGETTFSIYQLSSVEIPS